LVKNVAGAGFWKNGRILDLPEPEPKHMIGQQLAVAQGN